jgi:hypothetical protein
MTRQITRYFVIKRDSRLIDDSDFLLRSKFIGVKQISSNGFAFIWDKPMTRAGVSRLIELGWNVCDENKNIVEDFFCIIDQCPIQFYAEG